MRPIIHLGAYLIRAMPPAPNAPVLCPSCNIDLLPGTPDQLVARVRSEIPLWTKLMLAAGVQPE